MNALQDTLRLDAPLRGVRLASVPRPAPGDPAREREAAAYERGRREAETAMNEQLMTQRRELLELQNGVFESLRNAIPQVIRESEGTLAELALEVAQKVLAGLPISAEMIGVAIREALGQLEESAEFHIYLHPEDLRLLREVNSELLDASPQPPHYHFHPSEESSRGGCVVRTRFGILDASRENKLAILKESLLA
jgi:flagellar assembly protein FliH